MNMRLVHLWSARAKQAVIMRIPSDTLPRRAAYFSDGTTLGYRSWPPPWPRCAACALLKTSKQFSQIKRDEGRKRQAWLPYRSWSRMTSGVLLSVIGAVPYGTSKVFYKLVPHFDAQALRHYLHHVMATFS